MVTGTTNEVFAETRSLSDLPPEILSAIADRLPIIELLSFRGTCNDFRSASTTASASIESTRTPWLLLHKSDSSECLIYNNSQSKTYNRSIPDLKNAICLASYDGWFLLFKDDSIFFFCPFSFSKITLPNFPHKQIEGHVAAFSNAPTSPNCIVSVINRVDDLFVEINVISKGQSSWTPHKLERGISLGSTIVGATFDQRCKEFCYMDDGKTLLTFSLNDKKGQPFRILKPGEKTDMKTKPLSYCYEKDVFRNKIKDMSERFNLEEDEYVAVCGLSYKHEYVIGDGRRMVYLNEVVDDSPTKTQVRRAVWVQPRFFGADANHRW